MKIDFGIEPRNEGQDDLQRLLYKPSKEIVVATGPAGTGKSIFILKYILETFLANKPKFNKIIITKPLVYVGNAKNLGPVPGDIGEKMRPFLLNFQYTFEELAGKQGRQLFERMVKSEDMRFIPIEQMRGLSVPKGTILYVDEAQSLSDHMINTLGTRMGEGSRLILSGDLNQIDNGYDPRTGTQTKFNSGLATVVNSLKFKKSKLAGHVHLTEIERGPIAKLFTEIFEAE